MDMVTGIWDAAVVAIIMAGHAAGIADGTDFRALLLNLLPQ
jgi:hypothetical protein